MRLTSRTSRHASALTGALLLIGGAVAGPAASARTVLAANPVSDGTGSATPPDSVPPDALIQPAELARLLAGPAAQRPRVLQVGFRKLYGAAHIPNSRYIGAGSDEKGLRALQTALRPLPRRQPVVLYCGCCPWGDCPNIRPALRTARTMGFQNARVLFLPDNLAQDWIDKGFPTVKYKE